MLLSFSLLSLSHILPIFLSVFLFVSISVFSSLSHTLPAPEEINTFKTIWKCSFYLSPSLLLFLSISLCPPVTPLVNAIDLSISFSLQWRSVRYFHGQTGVAGSSLSEFISKFHNYKNLNLIYISSSRVILVPYKVGMFALRPSGPVQYHGT